MKKIKWRLSIGYQDARQEDTMEFPDDATEEEIEKAVKQEVFDRVDWTYWLVDGGEEE